MLDLKRGRRSRSAKKSMKASFPRRCLGYKLQLLKAEFEQTERKLSTWIVTGTMLKKLERVCNEIKRLEAEFRCGRYHPDLLDEQIVINREELRLITVNQVDTSQPVYL